MKVLLFIVLLSFSCVGCNNQKTVKRGEYRTVAEDAIRLTEEAKRLNQQAVGLLEDGNFDEAQTLLTQALSADVMYGPAHNNLGKVYYHQNKMYLAAWEFEYAVKLMPHQPEPKNNLGLVFESVGKINEAVSNFGQAYELEPDNPEIIANLARARVRRGDRDDSLRQLLNELILKDTRPEWLNWAREKLATMKNSHGWGE